MIPAQAVEALAAVLAQEALVSADMDGYGWDAENDDPAPFMPHARERARTYLEAAVPYMLAGVEDVLAQWDAEASGNQNVANELRKGPRTNMNRSEIARHEQAAVIAKNHATRIRNAIAGTR